MSDNHNPVPRLDLAPKLKRPLSLWNPLDYLRLLYWVFFFPQALRWYVDTFGRGYIPAKEMNWRKVWELLRQNPIQHKLLLQAVVVAVVTPLAVSAVLQQIGVSIDWFRVALGVASGVALGVGWGVALGVASGVAFGVAFGVAWGVGILRPDHWLFYLLLTPLKSWNRRFQLSRLTPFPLPFLSAQLKNCLRRDWETGLHNANQLLAYTLQFIPAVQAVNHVLAETPAERVIFRVAQLAEAPYDWQLVLFASASLNAKIKSRAIEGLLFFFPSRWKRQILARFVTQTRADTPARATAAGFWYLHEKEPEKAAEAFAVVRSLLYGEEMLTLAQTLAAFHTTKAPAAIASMQVPAFPKEPLLRPATWEAIASLRRVVEDMQAVEKSVSRCTRSFALNRALGELTKILDSADIIPQAERYLIADIAKNWREYLLQVAGEVGEISITQPVRNPYVVGDPVEGKLFVGREDILRELEQLWVLSNQLQSVVLFGHRRMGKTSILRNTGSCLGSGVKVAYVNLLTVANASQGVAEVLMAICDAISSQVHRTPPDDTKWLHFPNRTFENYLKQVEANLEGGLIIALDEFEEIEELIEAGKIPSSFMKFLRAMVQMCPKIAFAFAGLHTLEEMTEDYFHPFFASVIPIKVGLLTPATARQILANPDDDFPLDYTPQALDRIYALTSGQPYLVQLIGFQLVRRYNELVFDMRRPREPVFSIDDVEAVINDELFTRGRYYFTGVWGQAAQGAAGQQAILRVLAPHAEGLTLDTIAGAAGVGSGEATAALETLKRHDVVAETESRWRIVVELFRRWVLQMQAGGQK